MQANQLINEIERAFNGAAWPDTSLRQFALTDQFGMSGTITKPQWDQAGRERVDSAWQDIPDSEIEECGCLLAHMQADDCRYYLPAYMRYAVKHFDNPVLAADILGGVASFLTPSTKDPGGYAHKVAQLASLDGSQKRAIVGFLQFVSTSADDLQRASATNALEGFWNHGADA